MKHSGVLLRDDSHTGAAAYLLHNYLIDCIGICETVFSYRYFRKRPVRRFAIAWIDCSREGEQGEMGNVFWILEGILYAVFLTGDWCDFFKVSWIAGTGWYKYSSICKYAALLLCVWHGCQMGCRKGDREKNVLAGVLLFSAAADYFLLFTDCFILGILLFCMVQCCYCLYCEGKGGEKALCRLAGTGICAAILAWCLIQAGLSGAAQRWNHADFFLVVTAVFYGSLLLQNVFRAWRSSGKVSVWGRMAILLLFLCDIHVALYNIEETCLGIEMVPWLLSWCKCAGVLMWLFYLPSQLCIVKCIQGKVPINNRKAA